MRVLITGGGSAGHITPLLAIAAELKQHDATTAIRYVGQRGDAMGPLVAANKTVEKCYKIWAGKWRRYHGLGIWRHIIDVKTVAKNLRDLFLFGIGFWQSLVIISKWRPDVVFIKGGFVGLPVGLAAALLKVKIVTHDSDAIPGLTNKILAKFATAQAVGMPKELYIKYYSLKKLHFTGVPVKAEFNQITARHRQDKLKHLGIKPNEKVVCVIGGSLGAVRLNEAVLGCLNELFTGGSGQRHLIWVTGKQQYANIASRLSSYKSLNKQVHLFSFVDDIQNIIAISDVVVSRAGATAIAEVAVLAKPLILVPNPYLAGGHQLVNAAKIKQANAAQVIYETELLQSPSVLAEAVNGLLTDTQLSKNLIHNLKSFAVPDAATRIVEVIQQVASNAI